jgi:hypothetical protein
MKKRCLVKTAPDSVFETYSYLKKELLCTESPYLKFKGINQDKVFNFFQTICYLRSLAEDSKLDRLFVSSFFVLIVLHLGRLQSYFKRTNLFLTIDTDKSLLTKIDDNNSNYQ